MLNENLNVNIKTFSYDIEMYGQSWISSTLTLLDTIFETLRSSNGYSLIQTSNLAQIKYWTIEVNDVLVSGIGTTQVNETNAYFVTLKQPIGSQWNPLGISSATVGWSWDSQHIKPLTSLQLNRPSISTNRWNLFLPHKQTHTWISNTPTDLTMPFNIWITTPGLLNFADSFSDVYVKITLYETVDTTPLNATTQNIYFVK